MKALTLWQPWSWAIAHAGKRVENRTWAPPASIIGQRVAIHAGLRLDKGAVQHGVRPILFGGTTQREFDLAHEAEMRMFKRSYVHGAVESVATLRGAVRMDYDTSAVTQTVLNGRHGELNRAACDEVLASPWRVSGMWQWVLTDVIALPEPVPCKGFQGLWTLPADAESAVLAGVDMARAREVAGG